MLDNGNKQIRIKDEPEGQAARCIVTSLGPGEMFHAWPVVTTDLLEEECFPQIVRHGEGEEKFAGVAQRPKGLLIKVFQQL